MVERTCIINIVNIYACDQGSGGGQWHRWFAPAVRCINPKEPKEAFVHLNPIPTQHVLNVMMPATSGIVKNFKLIVFKKKPR